MIERYEVYKDSRVEWLAEIPAEWEVKKLKYLVSINDEALPETTDERFLIKYVDISNVKSGVGILSIEELSFSSAPSRARRIVREGDVIVSTVRTYLRSITRISNPPENLIVSTGFAVIRPKKLNSDYTGYMFYSENLIGEIVSKSTGVSYPAISASEIGNIPVPIPNTQEQTAIANFLDRKTAEIAALIAQKERLLELYEEEKTAIINHAVTKGLDPDVELKDSEVEWLGEIPDGWEIKKLARIVEKLTNGYVGPTREIMRDSGVPYIQGIHIKNNSIKFTPSGDYYVEKDWSINHSKSILKTDDLLVVQTGSIGDVGIVKQEFDGANCHALLIVRVIKDHILPKYLLYYLSSPIGFALLQKIKTGEILFHINGSKLKGIDITLPPLNEQAAIVQYIESETARIDAKIAKTQRIIELQKEYRTALISEVVTGKIKVPQLPTQEASA